MAKSKKPPRKPQRHAGGEEIFIYSPSLAMVRNDLQHYKRALETFENLTLENLTLLDFAQQSGPLTRHRAIVEMKDYPMKAPITKITAIAISQTARTPAYRPSLILDLFVPCDRAEDMHANLGELYPVWVERHGIRRANFILSCQVARLIGGTWWEKFLSTSERLLKSFRIVGS